MSGMLMMDAFKKLLIIFSFAFWGCSTLPSSPSSYPEKTVDFIKAFALWGEAREADTALPENEEEQTPEDLRRAADLYLAAADAGFYMEQALPNAALRYVYAGDHDTAIDVFRRMARENFRFTGILEANVFSVLHSDGAWPGIDAQIRENATIYEQNHADIDNVKIIANDIERFWTAYDAAGKVSDRDSKTAVYLEQYFEPGTEGLHDFTFTKIGDIGDFVEFVEGHKDYYEGVRHSTRETTVAIPKIYDAYRRMQELYPPASFPDIYFVIGRHTSFGTASSAGNLIGAENLIDESTRVEVLPKGRQGVVLQAENLHQIVAHEYVHSLQQPGRSTVLSVALVEGGADFIGEMISSPYTAPRGYKQFGLENDERVWREFMNEKDTENTERWSANNAVDHGDDWSADLAYYVGFEIAKGYYAQAGNKGAAIRDLLEMKDPDEILKKSGYAERYAL